MLNHTFYLVFELNLIGIFICVDNPTFCRSATALMEVERATPPGFEEEILKPPEVLFTINLTTSPKIRSLTLFNHQSDAFCCILDFQQINKSLLLVDLVAVGISPMFPQVKEDLDEGMVNVPIETKEVVVNINRVLESDITNGVTKDSSDPKKEKDGEEEVEEEAKEKTNAVVLNGSSESILNGDDHDQDDLRLHSDEIKKEDDMITCEEKVKADITHSEEEGMVVEGVKEEEEENGEAMEQDTSRDPEPTPEPPEPPEDKGPKLEKAIYEEEIVDGFNFCSFETYPEVEVSDILRISCTSCSETDFHNRLFVHNGRRVGGNYLFQQNII